MSLIETPPFTISASGLTSFTNALVMAFASAGSAVFDISDLAIMRVD